MLISIMTPVYNRADLLKNVFASLQNQTLFNFEWIIINDGSTDHFLDIKSQFHSDKFPVKVLTKKNGGKHTAINLGVAESAGEWVFILDSDDWLVPEACELIQDAIFSSESDIDGYIFLKANQELKLIGQQVKTKNKNLHTEDLVSMKGDKAYIVRTSVMKNYPFPEYPDEKFVTESFIWNQIFDEGKSQAVVINKVIYAGEYLPGGLTAGYFPLLKKNVSGTFCFVMSNLTLKKVTLDVYKQAAYHFIPVSNLKNIIRVGSGIRKMRFVFFLAILFLMFLKLKLVKK
ncbi:hypothetical protein ED28_14865 [[Pantoea] beijingensis]|uniref:Glycosyltransferase 2-like domain-containing protein n=1 Tax=[Pantoea] beijingensis TaxID=1324864 RepID=A0A443IB28_9GAMM|nr:MULTISPECIES: glycosyltransferase family 2 protein [Erwiniaceae]RWR01200.1 hypothetical protein ED28_14865 [[Pantoea] beijingensis]